MGKALGENVEQKLEKLEKALEAQTYIFKKSVGTVQLDSDKKACCFACGKLGHIKRDCPTTTIKRKLLSICPQCQKGKHFAKYCCSQFDMDGKALSLNSKQSGGYHRASTQVVVPPYSQLPSQMALVPQSFIPQSTIPQMVPAQYPQVQGLNWPPQN